MLANVFAQVVELMERLAGEDEADTLTLSGYLARQPCGAS